MDKRHGDHVNQREVAVILKLVSEDLVFEEGEARFLTGMFLDVPSISAEAIPVRNNVIDHPNVPQIGEVVLILDNCIVRSRKNGLARRIRAFPIATTIAAEHVTKGNADIQIGVHAFARVQVLDEGGRPVQDQPVIGVVDDATLECRITSEGYADILLRPGKKMTYLFDWPTEQAWFDVPETGEDVGTITLYRRTLV